MHNIINEIKSEERIGTDGYQPKYLIENGRKFLKIQCILDSTLRDDWRVEEIASEICRQLNIYSVRQTPCTIAIDGKYRHGVVSDNFEKEGYKFVSFEKLLEMHGLTSNCEEFNNADAMGKINFIVNNIVRFTKIPEFIVIQYLFDMVTVDLLVLNQDRHTRNFGIFKNIPHNRYEVALLFDFGMGLFENNTIFDDLYTLDKCMRYSYIAPYGEDPFDLLDELKGYNSYYNYLRSKNIANLDIDSELFLNPIAYDYFIKMKELMGD